MCSRSLFIDEMVCSLRHACKSASKNMKTVFHVYKCTYVYTHKECQEGESLHKLLPLICRSLSPPQLSAGKVKIRVLKDEPLTGEQFTDPA